MFTVYAVVYYLSIPHRPESVTEPSSNREVLLVTFPPTPGPAARTDNMTIKPKF